MKKFKFSMDKVLSYKDKILSSEKMKMSSLMSKKSELFEELTKTQQHLNSIICELNLKVKDGTTIFEINKFTFHINSYKAHIEILNKDILDIENEIEAQRQVLLTTSKDVCALLNVKDNKFKEYKKKKNDIEAKNIEETVVFKKFYSN